MITDNVHRIVIVDDHPFLRSGLKSFLESDTDFSIIAEFSETRSLLHSSMHLKPDAIILDLNIPGLDGERSCGLLKQRFPGVKILAFTQYVGREAELVRAGFDGYLVKNESDSLIEALHCILNGGTYFRTGKQPAPHETVLFSETDPFLKTKSLTPREMEVAALMALDYSNREISDKLFIAIATVETHRKHVKEKLKAKTKRELSGMLKALVSAVR